MKTEPKRKAGGRQSWDDEAFKRENAKRKIAWARREQEKRELKILETTSLGKLIK